MWARSWVSTVDLVLPFPRKPPEDMMKIMESQRWKLEKMFKEAEEFFTSLGLLSPSPEFWKKSMFGKANRWGTPGPSPQFYLLYKTHVSSTEKDIDKMIFLGLELEPNKTKFRQWVLLALRFVIFLVTLLLACRLHSLEKRSLAQDTNAQDISSQDTSAFKTPTNIYFLGMAIEPYQAAKRQWILLGICLILMLCSISLTIWIFTQHNRKPPWMRAEWWD
ncbi:Angiotensin-Converting Enzyme [Manis pentadactyla]|nr:Angiotensin-Converting Enzyme [Manis pentadactyla]